MEDEDYPIEIFESERYECLYILTKNGYFHIYDTLSGTCLFLHQISFSPIVNCHLMADQGSVLVANQKVKLLLKSIELRQTLGYNKTSLPQRTKYGEILVITNSKSRSRDENWK